MFSPSILRALLLISFITLLAGTASAQTSMQRRAQEQNPQQEAATEETETAPQQQEEIEVIREERAEDGMFRFYRTHLPGLRLDFGTPWGSSQDNVIFGVGLGYMYALGWDIVPIEQTQAIIRVGAGPDLTLGVSNQGLHGISGFFAGRVGVVGTAAGGIEIEGALGAGVGQGILSPALRAGIYWAGEYAALGYFYQHVFRANRPDWMRPHFIGFRLHLPVLKVYP